MCAVSADESHPRHILQILGSSSGQLEDQTLGLTATLTGSGSPQAAGTANGTSILSPEAKQQDVAVMVLNLCVWLGGTGLTKNCFFLKTNMKVSVIKKKGEKKLTDFRQTFLNNMKCPAKEILQITE